MLTFYLVVGIIFELRREAVLQSCLQEIEMQEILLAIYFQSCFSALKTSFSFALREQREFLLELVFDSFLC